MEKSSLEDAQSLTTALQGEENQKAACANTGDAACVNTGNAACANTGDAACEDVSETPAPIEDKEVKTRRIDLSIIYPPEADEEKMNLDCTDDEALCKQLRADEEKMNLDCANDEAFCKQLLADEEKMNLDCANDEAFSKQLQKEEKRNQ